MARNTFNCKNTWVSDLKLSGTKLKAATDFGKGESSDGCLRSHFAGVKHGSTDKKDRGTMPSLKTETEIDAKSEQEIEISSESSSEGFEKRKQPDRHKRSEGKGAGYIYIMQDRPDRFKVGCSKTPESRLSQLQTGNVDLRLLHKEYVSSNRHWHESQVRANIPHKYRYYDPKIPSNEWYIGCTLDYLRGIIKRQASREYQN